MHKHKYPPKTKHTQPTDVSDGKLISINQMLWLLAGERFPSQSQCQTFCGGH